MHDTRIVPLLNIGASVSPLSFSSGLDIYSYKLLLEKKFIYTLIYIDEPTGDIALDIRRLADLYKDRSRNMEKPGSSGIGVKSAIKQTRDPRKITVSFNLSCVS